MSDRPRVVSVSAAEPPYRYAQAELLEQVRDRVLGPCWQTRPEAAESAREIERLFIASRVEQRTSAVPPGYYDRARTTGERMAEYQPAAYGIGRAAVEACLRDAGARPADVTDLVVVSCTGYGAPGLDVLLARDLGMPQDVRRVVVGHMGCFAAIVGLRQCLATVRSHPVARALLLSVELPSLHFRPSLDTGDLVAFALFGDAAAAVLLADGAAGGGPELVDTYCAADFSAAAQMTWTITDHGFVLGLSRRVPVTLRRNVARVVARLLQPHGLEVQDVTHWIVHPGGPSIVEAVQGELELRDEQVALSWQVLREHGNCSSATVLIILRELLRSGRALRGEWAVMLAFGPGLTLESCLLRF